MLSTDKNEAHVYETAISLCTGLDAIIAHARAIADEQELDGEGVRRVDMICMLARYSLRLARELGPSVRIPEYAVASDASRDGETILLVEDESAVRHLISRILQDRGFQVLEARNGEDALDIAARHAAPIHLVLTDVMMPHMTGGELFDTLRGWYPGLRVLFMSGYDVGVVEAHVRDAPVTAFIPKPFAMDDLFVAVRRLLDER